MLGKDKVIALGAAVKKACTGDQSGFTEIYNLTNHYFRYFVRQKIFDVEEAEDVLQDFYMEITRPRRLIMNKTLSDENAGKNFLGLGREVVRSTLNAYHDKNSNRYGHEVMTLPSNRTEGKDCDFLESAPDYGTVTDPEEFVIRKEMIETFVNGLPDKQKEIIPLWTSGYKMAEIAEMTGTCSSTVKTRIRLIRKKADVFYKNYTATG